MSLLLLEYYFANIQMRMNEMSRYEALLLAVDILHSQQAMADLCEVSQPTVWRWLNQSKQLPAEHVLKVEAATSVSRHLLRPDIYPREIASLPASSVAEPTPLCGAILSARNLGRNGNRASILDKGEAA
jgi:DNA-binding transcriptional regulator YdaS (Cro superfamily)